MMEWVRSTEGFLGCFNLRQSKGSEYARELLMQLRKFIRIHQQVKNGSDVTRM